MPKWFQKHKTYIDVWTYSSKVYESEGMWPKLKFIYMIRDFFLMERLIHWLILYFISLDGYIKIC